MKKIVFTMILFLAALILSACGSDERAVEPLCSQPPIGTARLEETRIEEELIVENIIVENMIVETFETSTTYWD